MLHKPVTVLVIIHIFHSYEEICDNLHKPTNVQTLRWSETSPSFTGAHSSCISRSINTDFMYLNMWCDSKYITIKQLNEWVKQFTLSVYASK